MYRFNLLSRFPLALQLCLLFSGLLAGCTTTSADDPAPADPSPAAVDTYWPVALEATEGHVEVYQPQPDTMKGDMLTARSAVSLARPDGKEPVFGAAWFSAHIITDRDTRTVTLRDVTVKDVRLPGSTAAEQRDFARAISGRLSAAEIIFPLDQLTTSLDTAQQEQTAAEQINTNPPHILISTTPATLISINGAPKLIGAEGHPGVSRVINTPFILLFDDAAHRYYLKAGQRWVIASELAGPWADTATVPPAINAAGEDMAAPSTQPTTTVSTFRFGTATTGTSQQAPAAVDIAAAAADAKIIVATEPTELIVTTGDPQFAAVPGAGGNLLFASNTESDLFLDQSKQHYYALLSGRWYSAASLQGPWSYIRSDALPPAFAQIPADSAKGDVLSFIAGTTQAHEAVLDASIPQTASISRDAGDDLSVAYDGEARFQDVPESPGVAYATNSPEDVLRVDGRYYCCHQAVWYESAAATGPWTVCVSVPPAIYTLPPSCPAYHVRYVNVYNYYPDYVTCGYLPGYTGTYVYGPTIVYGTGYTYPGWYGSVYFPPPCTWGFAASYDPFACTWGFDVGLYWGGIGWFGRPFHERWWRDHPGEHWGWHRWWGPGGFVHSHEMRNHLVDSRDGAFRDRTRGQALSARMPGTDRRGPGWNNLYARDGNVRRNIPADRVRTFTPARTASGARDNVFAGRDGNVFRRSNNGWEERGTARSGWTGMTRVPEAHPTYRPPSTPAPRGGSFASPGSGLDQHFNARSRGTYRSSAIHSFNSGGFRGGGGARGSGGRR